MDIQLLLARYVLGYIRSDDLPSMATDLLTAGYESEVLVELAGLDLEPFDPRDATDLWQKAAPDLELRLPAAEEAVLTLAGPIALDVVRGDLDPLAGAGRILEIGSRDPDAYHLVAGLMAAADVSGYYESEPGLSREERTRGLESLREIARSTAERLANQYGDLD